MIDNLYFRRPLNDVYDLEGFTTSEILSQFHTKIKEVIKAFNEIDTQFKDYQENINAKIDYLINIGIKETVARKIQEMYDNGDFQQIFETLNTNISNYIEVTKDNKNKVAYLMNEIKRPIFKTPFGCNIEMANSNQGSSYSLETIKKKIDDFKDAGIKDCMLVIHTYVNGNALGQVESNELIDQVYNYLINSGLNVIALKIHCNDFRKALTGTSLTTNQKEVLKVQWLNLIQALAIKFQNKIENFIVINEGDSIYKDSTYTTFVIDCLQKAKDYGYKASITTSSIKNWLELPQAITDNLDFICSNAYPPLGNNGLDTPLSTVVTGFTRSGIETWCKIAKEKYPDKEVWLTETGCEDRESCLILPYVWDFGNGETFNNGKVQALALEGLFISFENTKLDRIFNWYPLRGEYAKNIIKYYVKGVNNLYE